VRESILRALVFALALAGAAWVYWGLDLPRHTSVEGIRALVESHAPYGPLVYMAIVVAGIFVHVPMMGTVLVAVGGVLFGGLAFVYAWVAALAGTTATFLIVRYVARDYVQRALNGPLARLRALDERLTRNGFWTVLGLRCVLFLAPPLNWEIGLTGVRFRHYLAGTALGLVPGMAMTVFFADSIATRLPISRVLSPSTVVAAVIVIAVVAAATRTRRGRSAAPPG